MHHCVPRFEILMAADRETIARGIRVCERRNVQLFSVNRCCDAEKHLDHRKILRKWSKKFEKAYKSNRIKWNSSLELWIIKRIICSQYILIRKLNSYYFIKISRQWLDEYYSLDIMSILLMIFRIAHWKINTLFRFSTISKLVHSNLHNFHWFIHQLNLYK